MKSKKTSKPAGKSAKVTSAKRAVAKPAPQHKKTPTAKPKSSHAAVKPARQPAARRRPAPKVPPILLEGDTPPLPPVHGPGQKYALGPAAPPAHASGETGELPEAYGTERLLLVARDPHWIFAHWDFTAEQRRRYNRLSADGHLVLRVFLNAPGHPPHTEVHVHPESNNWFVHVGKAGARYVAQIGYYDQRGKWTAISESQATLTPPDSLSEDTSARFATVPVEVPYERLLEVVKAAAREHLPLAQAIQEIAREQMESAAAPAAPPAGAASLAQLPPAAAPGQWTPEQERALAELVSMDAVRRVWIGSLEITELVRRRLARELASLAAVPAAPGQVPGSLGSISSPFGAAAPGPKGFWFNVNAELIVYGATEPDATVTIGGRRIQLRPDGSFSYRFALPDGQYDLPIVATAADQSDRRAADLKFSRQTAYQGEVGAHPQDAALKLPRPENTQ